MGGKRGGEGILGGGEEWRQEGEQEGGRGREEVGRRNVRGKYVLRQESAQVL